MIKTISISPTGVFTIPVEFRKKYGFKLGGKATINCNGTKMFISPHNDSSKLGKGK